MAIGSDPEIGIKFLRWGEMSEEQQQEWFEYMKREYGPDLVGGYGTLVYIERTTQGGTTTDGVEISEVVEEPDVRRTSGVVTHPTPLG